MKLVRDRFDVIGPLVAQGAVLDLGCVDARPARAAAAQRIEQRVDLLFKRICQANPQTIGLDIDAEGVAVLATMGYNVMCADAATADLGRQFDTIVAGEIIEHIENPGQFLRNLRRHLKPAGRLIVSTPNPFSCAQVWRIWRHGRPSVHEGHMGWQDPSTLTALLRRAGFDVVEGYWVRPRRSLVKTWKQLFRAYFSHSFMLVAAIDSCVAK